MRLQFAGDPDTAKDDSVNAMGARVSILVSPEHESWKRTSVVGHNEIPIQKHMSILHMVLV